MFFALAERLFDGLELGEIEHRAALQCYDRLARQLGHHAARLRELHTLGQPCQMRVLQGRADARLDVATRGDAPALGPRLVGAHQANGQDVRVRGERQVTEGRLELRDHAVLRARALWKEQDGVAGANGVARLTQRLTEIRFAVERLEVGELLEVGPLHASSEEVVLSSETHDSLAVFAECILDEPMSRWLEWFEITIALRL